MQSDTYCNIRSIRGRRRSISGGGGGHIFIYSCCASLISFEIDCVPPPNCRSSAAPALNYRSEESIPDSYDKCELGLCAGFMLIFVCQGINNT